MNTVHRWFSIYRGRGEGDEYHGCQAVSIIDRTIADTDNQRVIINVKDVNDEPPYFINRPLPMQTVVQLNAPPNTHVFTLQARDPDTDSNIHYFIVRDRSTYELRINLIEAACSAGPIEA